MKNIGSTPIASTIFNKLIMEKEVTKEEALFIASKFGMKYEVSKGIENGLEPWRALYEWDLPLCIEEYNDMLDMINKKKKEYHKENEN